MKVWMFQIFLSTHNIYMVVSDVIENLSIVRTLKELWFHISFFYPVVYKWL